MEESAVSYTYLCQQ